MREADGVAGFVNNTSALHPFLSQNPAEPIVYAVSSKNSLLEAQRENVLLKKQIEEKLSECSGTNQHVDGRSQPIQYSVPNRRSNYSKNKTYARRNPSGRNWSDSSVAGKIMNLQIRIYAITTIRLAQTLISVNPLANGTTLFQKASPDH